MKRLLLAVVLLWPIRISAATIIETDATWKVTAQAPSPGWNTDLGFNERGFQAATILIPAGAENVGQGHSVNSIWGPTPLGQPGGEVWLRRIITLTAPVATAELDVDVDDDALVYINGALVVNDTSGVAELHLNNRVVPQ